MKTTVKGGFEYLSTVTMQIDCLNYQTSIISSVLPT